MTYDDAVKARAIELYYSLEISSPDSDNTYSELLDILEAEHQVRPTPRIIQDWLKNPQLNTKKYTSKFSDSKDEKQLTNDQKFSYERTIRGLEADKKSQQKRIKDLEKRADFISNISDSIAQNITPFTTSFQFRERPESSGHLRTVQGIFSDWHYNEYVKKDRFLTLDTPHDSTKVINAYDLDIGERRGRFAINAIGHQVLNHKRPKSIERIILVFNGDLNNGDIHAASVTNCTDSMTAAKRLAYFVADEIKALSEMLPWCEIHVIFKVGNHGRINGNRTQLKSTNDKTIAENYDFVTGMLVEALLAGLPKVTIENEATIATVKDVYGQNFMYTHGDRIRGGGGIAKVPMFGLARYVADQTINLIDSIDTKIHHIIIGHWHRHVDIEYGLGRILINPSLVGQTERGLSHGYSGSLAQRVIWSDAKHPLGATYSLDIPSMIEE